MAACSCGMPRKLTRTRLNGKTSRPATRWLFPFTASRTASRISASSGASLVSCAAPNGVSKMARPSFSIHSETGMVTSLVGPLPDGRGSVERDLCVRLGLLDRTLYRAARVCKRSWGTRDNAQVARGFDQIPRGRRGDLRAVAAMLHHHRKRDAARRIGIVRRESDEPGVRHAFVHLSGASLAGDA